MFSPRPPANQRRCGAYNEAHGPSGRPAFASPVSDRPCHPAHFGCTVAQPIIGGEAVPLGPEPKVQLIEMYRRSADLSVEELWWRSFALGSMNTSEELSGILDGTVDPTAHEYNLIAAALNEYLVEFDPGRSIPYVEDEPSSN